MTQKIAIIFFGTPDFAVRIFSKILLDDQFDVRVVVTQPDKISGRGNKLTPPPVKILAQEHNIPVLQPQSIKKEWSSLVPLLNAHGPYDIGIVVAFGQILPESLLAVPMLGCLNVHGSILPRWRGAAPIQRALMAGDSSTGISLMQMETGLDTGPVFITTEIPIKENDTFSNIHDELASVGAKLLCSSIHEIVSGSLRAHPQPEDGITYATKITKDEELIDWSRSTKELDCQIRALSPSPGAFTFLSKKRLKILRAYPLSQISSTSPMQPGVISFVDKKRLEVVCGDGVLSLEELQLEGKKILSVNNFLAGIHLHTGERLGS